MSADLTIYCLQQVTDYLEFERFCHDLMVLEGFSALEPLGGFSDKGRDALHVNKTSKEITIFAYSVREDWNVKLKEDARKINKNGHSCQQLVFITTQNVTAGQRDEAMSFIQNKYNWQLTIYSAERLRTLLDTKYAQLKNNYPQIFPPDILEVQRKRAETTNKDRLLILYDPSDFALASWLTRKLTAEGYQVWGENLQFVNEERYPEDLELALRNRVFRVISLYSKKSLTNTDLIQRRAVVASIGKEIQQEFLIALDVDDITSEKLDRFTNSLVFTPFCSDWAGGLQRLLTKLKVAGCPQLLVEGRVVATKAFLGNKSISTKPEMLVSNCLEIETVPGLIHEFVFKKQLPAERIEKLEQEWYFRKITSSIFLSFHQPPQDVIEEFEGEKNASYSSGAEATIDGISTPILTSELLRKALLLKCSQKGLHYCATSNLFYFPEGWVEGNWLKFNYPDGNKSRVLATGQRKFYSPKGSQEYKYYLAPTFSVRRDLFNNFVILVKVGIRFSDTKGDVLPKRATNSRRKHLTKNWWNNEWLNRLLAICDNLGEDGKITIGEHPGTQIIINARPVLLNAPGSVNETELDALSYERPEELLYDEDDEELETESEETE